MLQGGFYFTGDSVIIDEGKEMPSHIKADTIKKNLEEWNTIPDIELYKDLYELYQRLFLLTFNHKLKNVSYYIDIERDEGRKITIMYAEINNTAHLELKQRYNLHKKLIERVENKDSTLIFADTNTTYYDFDEEIKKEENQLSLFC